ncbi:hypothetical protein OsI_13042 [Oryza sativa Indica Group]|uniref:Piwi domain-containing protein n=1 Tax=Oryza sativa subsp. indica TaxID=39946 RepID=B8APJ4_ORYSI|nr:hypothetical protein OsI_13042 [Oryza sativa Indica Group]
MDWPEVSKYKCSVSSQSHREEIIADLFTEACASIEEGYLPPVTFVVVQKRHHTRLFPEDHHARDQMDRSRNILPGTVVDTKICHPSEFDFYLCSHSGIQEWKNRGIGKTQDSDKNVGVKQRIEKYRKNIGMTV